MNDDEKVGAQYEFSQKSRKDFLEVIIKRIIYKVK